jgi:hypothetical protein
MKTVTLEKGWQISRRLRQAGKQLSIDRIFDYFQGALLCVDQVGFGAGLTMAFLMVASFLLHVARSGAEKGVI